MGWARGISHDGRDIGYGVDAECDEEGCSEEIDRGLAYLCGDLDEVLGGDGVGCGRYFCGSHLFVGARWGEHGLSMCNGCWDRYDIDPETGQIAEDEDGRPRVKQTEENQ